MYVPYGGDMNYILQGNALIGAAIAKFVSRIARRITGTLRAMLAAGLRKWSIHA